MELEQKKAFMLPIEFWVEFADDSYKRTLVNANSSYLLIQLGFLLSAVNQILLGNWCKVNELKQRVTTQLPTYPA